MKRVGEAGGGLKTKLRNRMRTIRKKALAIALSARQKDERAEERRHDSYRALVAATRNVVNQAKRVIEEVTRRRRPKTESPAAAIANHGGSSGTGHSANQSKGIRRQQPRPGKAGKRVRTARRIIRKGKANRPTEFGNLLKIQEAEQQIITHYEVFVKRP